MYCFDFRDTSCCGCVKEVHGSGQTGQLEQFNLFSDSRVIVLKTEGKRRVGLPRFRFSVRRSREGVRDFDWQVKGEFTDIDWRISQIIPVKEHLVVQMHYPVF